MTDSISQPTPRPEILRSGDEWTRFLSDLLHEMRTPLSTVLVLVDLLLEDPLSHLDEREQRYARNIHRAVHDLRSLVGDADDLSRLLAGRYRVRAQDVPLEELVQGLEESVRTPLWQGGVTLAASIDPEAPQVLSTDPGRLKHALSLLVPAVAAHAASQVQLRVLPVGAGVCFRLCADGAPLPEEEPEGIEAIFRPFEDAGLRARREHGGRSLALPVAREIARALGGDLTAANRAGRPCFDLVLPAR